MHGQLHRYRHTDPRLRHHHGDVPLPVLVRLVPQLCSPLLRIDVTVDGESGRAGQAEPGEDHHLPLPGGLFAAAED